MYVNFALYSPNFNHLPNLKVLLSFSASFYKYLLTLLDTLFERERVVQFNEQSTNFISFFSFLLIILRFANRTYSRVVLISTHSVSLRIHTCVFFSFLCFSLLCA